MNKLATTIALFVASQSPARAQGNGHLDPPGPPTNGVYRTTAEIVSALDATRPGTPITALPITIDEPGLFYLPHSMHFIPEDFSRPAIRVQADGVCIDLAGHTLSGSSGIHVVTALISGNATTVVKNGRLADGEQHVFHAVSGVGRVERVAIKGSPLAVWSPELCVVDQTRIDHELGEGQYDLDDIGPLIEASVVRGSHLRDSLGLEGIVARVADRCSASGARIAFETDVVASCRATGGRAQFASGAAWNCSATPTLADPNLMTVSVATVCHAESTTGTPFAANAATNCSATTTDGGGVPALAARVAHLCRGTDEGGNYAIDAEIAAACTTGGGAITSPEKHLGTP